LLTAGPCPGNRFVLLTAPGNGAVVGRAPDSPTPAAAAAWRSPRRNRPGRRTRGWPTAPAAHTPGPAPAPATPPPPSGPYETPPATRLPRTPSRSRPATAPRSSAQRWWWPAASGAGSRCPTKVPGLQHGGVAGGLQLHRDPLRPGTVDRGVADEEVPPLAVSHRTLRARLTATSLIRSLGPLQPHGRAHSRGVSPQR
jgi:hypothetical protein